MLPTPNVIPHLDFKFIKCQNSSAARGGWQPWRHERKSELWNRERKCCNNTIYKILFISSCNLTLLSRHSSFWNVMEINADYFQHSSPLTARRRSMRCQDKENTVANGCQSCRHHFCWALMSHEQRKQKSMRKVSLISLCSHTYPCLLSSRVMIYTKPETMYRTHN